MHRGPDGSGMEILDNVGLVHTRLAIVDVSERAHQPMRHPGGDWWISFNGEIFNHWQSVAISAMSPSSPEGTPRRCCMRSRVGVRRYLPRLNGQFAFAAVDLAVGRLLLARDRFGIKPLYVARFDDEIWFASEPAALLAVGVDAITAGRRLAEHP